MTGDDTRPRMRLRWVWTWGRWLTVLLIAGGVVYQRRFAPIPIESTSAKRQTIVSEVMGTGTLEARVSTTISPNMAGRISQVVVDQGDVVEKGQLLVQLDDKELQQQVEIARANVEAAEAALVRLNADKSRSVAVFDQADKHHGRVQTLFHKGATTREELDRAVESLAIASSDTARAEAAISEGQKVRLAAEKTLEYHRARLADATIEAPFHGLIVARQREAGDIAVPGSAVLTLIATEGLWISAWVDETEMSKLSVKQPARIVFRSQPEQNYPGIVVRLGKQADRETREFVVDVQIARLPANWAVGQRAEVFIETNRRAEVLTIPVTAMSRRGARDGVFLLEDGVARWKPVTLGLRGRDVVEVREGVGEENVILLPATEAPILIEGKKVQVP